MSREAAFTPLIIVVLIFAALASATGIPRRRFINSSHGLCDDIDSEIPGRVFRPGSMTYALSQSAYYTSQERDLLPACVVRPTCADDVSRVVSLVGAVHAGKDTAGSGRARLAFRSGGHSFFANAANIDGGVTLDLRSLDSFHLSADGSTASVGGGSVWSQTLYPRLDPLNLTVAGSRTPGIGVGGFVTGGGLNMLERRDGFACDNVAGYEVVLASGEVVYASAAGNRDLWLALKGGSNNFGIVTRFDLVTHEQGLMLGGFIGFNATPQVLADHAKAFSKWLSPASFDPLAVMVIDLSYSAGNWTISDAIWYLDPVTRPKIYEEFLDIPGQTVNTLALKQVGAVVEESGELLPETVPRAIQMNFSLKNGNARVYDRLFSTFVAAQSAFEKFDGLYLDYLMQAHPVTKGENVLGLQPGVTDEAFVLMAVTYNHAADDAAVLAAMQGLYDTQVQIVRSAGLLTNFTYLNYAGTNQQPIQSYGTIDFLQQVSRKYDPQGFFQTAVPGPWKLFE